MSECCRAALEAAADEVRGIRANGGVGPYAKHFEDWLRDRAAALAQPPAGTSMIPCCEHCGCTDDRTGHDDTCSRGCNDEQRAAPPVLDPAPACECGIQAVDGSCCAAPAARSPHPAEPATHYEVADLGGGTRCQECAEFWPCSTAVHAAGTPEPAEVATPMFACDCGKGRAPHWPDCAAIADRIKAEPSAGHAAGTGTPPTAFCDAVLAVEYCSVRCADVSDHDGMHRNGQVTWIGSAGKSAAGPGTGTGTG